MYLDFFGLKSEPFRLVSDPRFLFLSRTHTRAKAHLDYALLKQDGFVAITGEPGLGKTMLVQDMLSRLGDDIVHTMISQTQLTEIEFLRTLLMQFGFNVRLESKAELLAEINGFFVEQHKRGRTVLLVVDDAQNLSPRVLEEIRLLSDLEIENQKVLNVILIGHPLLDSILNAPEMAHVAQRIRLKHRIDALSKEETGDYIKHRLRVAGNTNQTIFLKQTMLMIYRYTGGIPRLINILCDVALTAAFAKADHIVSPQVLDVAIEELQWAPFSKRIGTESNLQPELKQVHTPRADRKELPDAFIGNTTGTTIESRREPLRRIGRRIPDQYPKPRLKVGVGVLILGALSSILGWIWIDRKAHEPYQQTNGVSRNTKALDSDKDIPSQYQGLVASDIQQDISGLRSEQWLLDQDPEGYLIELIRVDGKTALQRFVQEQDLNTQLAYFPSRRHEKDGYVLVTGAYPNFHSANSARRALPDAVRAIVPWVRKMKDVHREIVANKFSQLMGNE